MARKKAKALPPKMITVYAEILQETEDGLLVRCDDEADGVWLPKSQIEYAGERGDTGVAIDIPDWLADEKGFFDGMGKPAATVAVEAGIIEDPDFREVDENPADKRAFGDNVKWIKEEPVTVSQPLSDAEKARYAEEMAALDKEIEELEDERSDVSSRLKKQIDAKEQERREMSAHVNDGELRTITCDCLKDYDTGEMVWTEAWPPYAEVMRRKMTKEEMQPSLLEYSEKMAAPDRPLLDAAFPELASAPAASLDFDDLSGPANEDGIPGTDEDTGETDAPEADADELETSPKEAA